MTSPPDDTTADTSAIIAALRTERDTALAREAALAEELAARTAELAQRDSVYSERIKQRARTAGDALRVENQELRAAQAAGLEVLQAMIASPGDTQPVLDLIAREAAKLCDVPHAVVARFDGAMIHLDTQTGMDPAGAELLAKQFPRPPSGDIALGRAILSRRIEQIEDLTADPDRAFTPPPGHGSLLAVPLLRNGVPLGAIAIGRQARGPFSRNQITLLQTFAEQAVIAISSSETYRALQERTEALATRNSEYGEQIEHQSATIDVLKAMSSSPGDPQLAFDLIARRARELCKGWSAGIADFDGELVHFRAWDGQNAAAIGPYASQFPMAPTRVSVACRAIMDRQMVHVRDARAEPELLQSVRDMGLRSLLALPLLRGSEAIGVIALTAMEPGGFSDSQVELLKTFAEQAVIAITSAETYRALQTRTSDLQETLEYQTAISDVLKVINRSTFDLQPVLDTLVETAARLCDADNNSIATRDGEVYRVVASFGLTPQWNALVRTLSFRPGRDTITGRTLLERQVIQIADITADPEYRLTGAATVGNLRTLLGVPLLREGNAIGVMQLSRCHVEPFTDRQIELVSTFADQAVIAMENARLISETREALEQQTATAEVLQVINASPGNLTPVFDAMLEKAMHLCEAAFGELHTYEGGRFRAVALRGVPMELSDFRMGNPVKPNPGTVTGRIVEGMNVVHIDDLMAEEAYQTGSGQRRALVDLGGARSYVAVPLRTDNRLLGTIGIYRQEVRPFTDKQISLLESFAAQAVIAMENARLITEQREALEQQTATAEVLQVINASPGNLAPVFDTILGKAMRLCGAAFGTLSTFDGERRAIMALRGLPPAYEAWVRAQGAIIPPMMLRLIETKRPLQIADRREGYRDGFDVRAGADLGGVRTLLHVPLLKDETVVGCITVYRQEIRLYADKEIALLENFAAQAVIAIENTRLLTEQREALEQQTATAEVLQVINASPGDLAPVFDALLERAVELCDAAHGVLRAFDGEFFHLAAVRGEADAVEGLKQLGAIDLASIRADDMLGAIVRGEAVVHITDVRETDTYRDNPIARERSETLNQRTWLAVALRKDGVLLGVIMIYRTVVRPFTSKQAALLQNFAAQAVIAMENARLLNEVRQHQEELRITFENMGDGVALFDETPRLVAWNRHFQEMFDLPGDLLERHRTYEEHLGFLAARGDFGSGRDAEEQLRVLLTSTDKPRVYERTRPDGRVLEIRRNPVPDGGFVLIFSDITERKRSEAEIRAARDAAEEASRTIEAAYRELKAAQANLIQAEKMASLGQLTAGIAHEIKNPLNFVNNFAALSVDLLSELKETAAPGFAVLTEQQRAEVEEVSVMLTSNLEKITEHGKRADGIVKAMLEHSRGSSGERRMVDLNALIDEALNLAYHGARAQDQSFNITLERDFGQGITPVEVNPQDITRVFLNLFSNGFYATTRRARSDGDAAFVPTLKVTTIDAGEAVDIRVRDNGSGIPADIRDKLFQPFFTTKPTGEGTGLGLSITYDIVTQQHGGSIAVDSKVGEYSEFTILLPRYRP